MLVTSNRILYATQEKIVYEIYLLNTKNLIRCYRIELMRGFENYERKKWG